MSARCRLVEPLGKLFPSSLDALTAMKDERFDLAQAEFRQPAVKVKDQHAARLNGHRRVLLFDRVLTRRRGPPSRQAWSRRQMLCTATGRAKRRRNSCPRS